MSVKEIYRKATVTLVVVSALTICCLTGCGTFWGHMKTPPNVPNRIEGAKYYRGVQMDIWLLKNGFGVDPSTDGALGLVLYPIFIADLPVSCAADTLCLPIDKHLEPATETLK